MTADGRVTAIHLAPAPGADPQAVDAVRAVADRGLEGDRYFADTGTFADRSGSDLTLVAAEALAALAAEAEIDLDPGTHRRNLTTTGLDLGALVGERFRVGEAVCVGTGPCTPCAYLEDLLAEPGLREALDGRGGLRARIVDTGVVRTGDDISLRPTNGQPGEY
jgi:MOSC domain-containing protein YiiM